jgi:hypothetical protein
VSYTFILTEMGIGYLASHALSWKNKQRVSYASHALSWKNKQRDIWRHTRLVEKTNRGLVMVGDFARNEQIWYSVCCICIYPQQNIPSAPHFLSSYFTWKIGKIIETTRKLRVIQSFNSSGSYYYSCWKIRSDFLIQQTNSQSI